MYPKFIVRYSAKVGLNLIESRFGHSRPFFCMASMEVQPGPVAKTGPGRMGLLFSSGGAIICNAIDHGRY